MLTIQKAKPSYLNISHTWTEKNPYPWQKFQKTFQDFSVYSFLIYVFLIKLIKHMKKKTEEEFPYIYEEFNINKNDKHIKDKSVK